MRDLTDYLLGQALQKLHSIESDLHKVEVKVDELATWAQRLALLGALWGGGIILNLAPDKAGEMIAGLIKSLK